MNLWKFLRRILLAILSFFRRGRNNDDDSTSKTPIPPPPTPAAVVELPTSTPTIVPTVAAPTPMPTTMVPVVVTATTSNPTSEPMTTTEAPVVLATTTLAPTTTTTTVVTSMPVIVVSTPTPIAAPSIIAPTTVAPTTAVPTTEAPTMVQPTTEAPIITTIVPTTVAPTTMAPITIAPTTVAPTTVAPTITAPTSAEPTTVAPTTAAPTATEPTTMAPTTAAPSTAAPSTAAPSTAAPSTAAPSTTAPSTAAPSTAAPSTAAPSTAAPTTAEPSTTAPTTEAPTTAAPVVITAAPVVVATPTPVAVVVPSIESFLLIHAPTNTVVSTIVDNSIIDVASVPSPKQFNVQVIPAAGITAVEFVETNRRESTAPLAFCGDNAGDYAACGEIQVGDINTVSAIPINDQNMPLATVAISFELVDSSIVRIPGEWIEIDANADIEQRHEACFVMVDLPSIGRRGYLIGGRGIKRTDIWNPVARSWIAGAPTPIQLHHMQCVAAQDKIWVVAAWTGDFPRETNPEFAYVYDPATDAWSTRTAMPLDRRRGGAAVMVSPDEKQLYVAMGTTGGHETADHAETLGYLDVYNITSDSWTELSSDAPHPRDHTGGAYMDGRLCIAGGRLGGEQGWPEVGPTVCYDLGTKEWVEEAPIPYPRAGASYGISCDGHLIVAGGEGSGKAWDNVDVFDGSNWSTMGSLQVGRHGSGLGVDCVCNQITIASGAISPGGAQESKSVEMYFPSGQDTECLA